MYQDLIIEINEELKKSLSGKRYKHSIGVLKKSAELAEIYHYYNIEKAALVGLTHDIGKEYSDDELLDYCEHHHVEVSDVESQKPSLLHAKVGADICKEKYNFDQEMVEAIKFHTTGRENMSLLDKIIYVADKTEEHRKGDLDDLRKTATNDLDMAVTYLLNAAIKKALEKETPLDPNTIKARNYLLVKKQSS